MTASFDFAPLLPAGLPPAAIKWKGAPKYNFTGGNNDAAQVPLDGLVAAADTVLRREGRNLASYGLTSGPQGYQPLREFLAGKLNRDAGIACTFDDIVIVSGSLQALDLVNGALLARGDTVIIEQDSYQGSLNRLKRLGVEMVGIPLDREGMRMDALAAALADLRRRNVRPKYIYTIPTVQNPTGTIMPEQRRIELLRLADEYGVPVFEDDCYADLVWDGARPPALYAMDKTGGVIHIGSFSKSLAPALRVGFIVAPWAILSRMLALKTDAGSGALEQMVLAEFCAPHFATHVPKLRRGLRAKLDTLMDALNAQFGTAAEFDDPKGGIFLWVKLPDQVDTMKLYQSALAAGVAINPGPEWSTDATHARSRMRLCFASPSHDEIRAGVAALAEVCRAEFGVPARIANVEQRARA
jgi:2-aminoadipate transaminase